MNKISLTLTLAMLTILASCTQPAEKSTTENEMEKQEMEITEEVAQGINTDSIVNSIQLKREQIETEIGEPVVIMTDSLRAKVKQKWEKIHFYTMNDKVARIKTYPYNSVSERTEEFYLDNDNLILAVIEDNGEGERKKKAEEIDKMYYFFNGKIIKEVKSESEAEYSIKEGDSEELLAEVKEYLDIYAKR